MKRFFVDRAAVQSGKPTLTGPDVKHVRTVLRLRPGDEVSLFDGQGWDYCARIEALTPRAVTLEVLKRFPSISESPVKITIGQALLRGRKMDRVVRQLTELGIHALIPVIAERSIPRLQGDRWLQKQRRWEAIAAESLKQCGRFCGPRLEPPMPLETVIGTAETYDLSVVFHDDEGLSAPESDPLEQTGQIRRVLALVGPEGGFAPGEIKLAVSAGFACISFGPRVLKADTAVVAAGAILQHALGDMSGLPKKA